MVKNPSANSGDIRDVSLIPRVGRSPGEGMATHSNVLAWGIPWTEEPGRATVQGVTKELDATKPTKKGSYFQRCRMI